MNETVIVTELEYNKAKYIFDKVVDYDIIVSGDTESDVVESVLLKPTLI